MSTEGASRLHNLIDWLIHVDPSLDHLSNDEIEQVGLEQVSVQLPHDRMQETDMCGSHMQLRQCMVQLGQQAGAEKRIGKTVWLMNFFRPPAGLWMRGEVMGYDGSCGVHLLRVSTERGAQVLKRVHFALNFVHMGPTAPEPGDPPYLPRFTLPTTAMLQAPAAHSDLVIGQQHQHQHLSQRASPLAPWTQQLSDIQLAPPAPATPAPELPNIPATMPDHTTGLLLCRGYMQVAAWLDLNSDELVMVLTCLQGLSQAEQLGMYSQLCTACRQGRAASVEAVVWETARCYKRKLMSSRSYKSEGD
eukprot:CAMPEP_0202903796 /NCGR_PEP_ID=MMETSP1392-20130828/26390_1 /ASSEMBLY_ACC=CAM_ASM_000868 /TAXON_ID=225041 /ORGANISM="Chlamydomonas chlamydogama, Strain SAG 11-48b" /LENGTH=303 /DNA_ID=CAMNT_0049591129 /DNA_START=203 /DNA_END=1114 /DNA_ORIENTATION=+